MGLMCGARGQMIETLNKVYGEKLVTTATIDSNALAVYASESGSFTILIIDTEGRACVLAGGHDWQQWKREKPKPETRDG